MIPYMRGTVSPQAHVGVPDGLCEEEYARNGFFGRYAHFYRTEPPVNWTRIEGPLKPQAFDTSKTDFSEDWLKGRSPILGNDDVAISFSMIRKPWDYFFRNADGDDIQFIHEGSGLLETDFGPLKYEAGDYIVIPRGTVYRFLPEKPTKLLTIESFSEVGLPDKGMLGQHALFDPAVIRVPTPQQAPTSDGKTEYVLKIKRRNEITTVYYPFYPINVVGWKGTLTVWQINVRDIRPVSSDRYHLPPSAHTTFVARNFVICSFLPRPLENGDPKAVKVPFYHSNIDFDEVIFYHAGEFFSRTGIGQGMITFHPQGIHHGPQKGAIARSQAAKQTNEVAVMIDTRQPLRVLPSAGRLEIADYWQSWK